MKYNSRSNIKIMEREEIGRYCLIVFVHGPNTVLSFLPSGCFVFVRRYDFVMNKVEILLVRL